MKQLMKLGNKAVKTGKAMQAGAMAGAVKKTSMPMKALKSVPLNTPKMMPMKKKMLPAKRKAISKLGNSGVKFSY